MCLSILTSGFCFAQESTIEFENGEKIKLAIEWHRPEIELERLFAVSFGIASSLNSENFLSFSPQVEYEKRFGKFLVSSKNYFFNFFDPRFELGSYYRLASFKSSSRQKVFLQSNEDYFQRIRTKYYVKTRVPVRWNLDFYAGYSFMAANTRKPISLTDFQEAFNESHYYQLSEKEPVIFTHSLDFGLALVRNTYTKYQVNDETKYRYSQMRISFLGHYALDQNLRLEYNYQEIDPNTPGRLGPLRTVKSTNSNVLDAYKIPFGYGIRFEKRTCENTGNNSMLVGNYEISLSYFPLMEGEAFLLRYATGLGGARVKTN